MKKADLSRELIRKFPNAHNLTLAKKLYNDNKLLFKSIDTARDSIRYARSAHGKANRGYTINTGISRTPEQIEQARLNPYGLPESHAEKWEPIPFPINKGRGLVIADLHIPYHEIEPINISFDWAKKNKYTDFILIMGDLQDHYQLSKFNKNPNNRKYKDEIKDVNVFFDALQKQFPNARIIYMKGNHEYRLESYLMLKAPELFDESLFSWADKLKIKERGIFTVEYDRILQIGKLALTHGSILKGLSTAVSPARGAFLKACECIMVAHWHTSNEHSDMSIFDRLITAWSIGCLCNLHPDWLRVNKWNWGCAGLEVDGDDFEIENKRIFKGIIR